MPGKRSARKGAKTKRRVRGNRDARDSLAMHARAMRAARAWKALQKELGDIYPSDLYEMPGMVLDTERLAFADEEY